MPKRSSIELTKRAIENIQPKEFLWDGGQRGINGLCLRSTPAGSKAFAYRYRTASGAQKWITLGSYPALTLDQAREVARRRAGEVAAGNDPSKARQGLRDAPTVASLAEYYLGDYAASRPLRSSTVRDARDVLRHALPSIGRIKIAEITPADIRKVRMKVRAGGAADAKDEFQRRINELETARKAVEAAEQDLAAAIRTEAKIAGIKRLVESRRRQLERLQQLADRAEKRLRSGRAGIHQANRLLAVLSVMFALAKREWGACATNPCEGLQREPEDQRWRNLSEAEVGRLLDACDAYEAENAMESYARGAADAIRLLLFTGARLREVLRAEWDQFNLELGVWEKPSSHTKIKRQHRLELDGPALELLQEMNTRRQHARLLFPGDPGKSRLVNGQRKSGPGAVKPRVDLKRPWSRLVKLAGLDDVRLHDLRRTTASFILSGGASLATVGKALGHTQASTTARYAHLSPTVQREGLKVAGERMASLRGKEKPKVIVMDGGR